MPMNCRAAVLTASGKIEDRPLGREMLIAIGSDCFMFFQKDDERRWDDGICLSIFDVRLLEFYVRQLHVTPPQLGPLLTSDRRAT